MKKILNGVIFTLLSLILQTNAMQKPAKFITLETTDSMKIPIDSKILKQSQHLSFILDKTKKSQETLRVELTSDQVNTIFPYLSFIKQEQDSGTSRKEIKNKLSKKFTTLKISALSEIFNTASYLSLDILYKTVLESLTQQLNSKTCLKAFTNNTLNISVSAPNYIFNKLIFADEIKLLTMLSQKSTDSSHISLQDCDPTTISKQSFNDNKKLLATGEKNGTICVWDCITGKKLHQFATEGEIINLIFNHTNELLVSIASGKAQLWNLKADEFNTGLRHRNNAKINSAAFNKQGTRLITGDDQGRICFWNITEPIAFEKAFKAHEKNIEFLNFNDAGNKIITTSRDKTAQIWDVQTCNRIVKLEDNDHPISIGVFNPNDDTQIVTGSVDGTACLWDIKFTTQSKKIIRIPPGKISDYNPIRSIRFSHNNKLILIEYDTIISMYNVDNSESLNFDLPYFIDDIDFAPDKNSLMLATATGTISTWKFINKSFKNQLRTQLSLDQMLLVNLCTKRWKKDKPLNIYDHQHLLKIYLTCNQETKSLLDQITQNTRWNIFKYHVKNNKGKLVTLSSLMFLTLLQLTTG